MIEVLMDHPSRTGRKLAMLLGRLPANGWVNWTGRRAAAVLAEGPVLNYMSKTNKLEQLIQLELKGVKVPNYYPGTELMEPPMGFGRNCPVGYWLPRRNDHQQGRDFTQRDFAPDFWTQKLGYDDEWRIHVAKTAAGNYKVLRSGIKIPNRRDFHPWVRSHRLGWKISYTGGAPACVLAEARKAVAALALDFAAVDVADVIRAEHDPVVLEVNTCPGLDTGTLQYYAEAIYRRLAR